MKDKIIWILTIMIVIVGGILVYQYIFEEKIDDNESGNVSDNIADNENDIANDDGEMIVQFNKEFYDLKNIAKEYVSFRNIDGVSNFSYDLDGDGVVDKIKFYEENYSYIVELNGKKVIESEYSTDFYIADLNEKDNLLEVVLYDDGPSGDPGYVVYSKKGNNLEKSFEGSGDSLKLDREGLVLFGDFFMRNFNPSIFFDYFYLENGNVINKSVDIDSINNIDISSTGWFFSENYSNKDKVFNVGLDPDKLEEINVLMLTDDIKFKILNVEDIINQGYKDKKIKVELKDGRVGYIFYVAFSG